MLAVRAIVRKISTGNSFWFVAYAVVAAFSTYFCMYAFRRPLSAATYEGLSLWGVDYKIVLVTTQVLGYAMSKFIGIRIVSEMTPERRAKTILAFIGVAWLALLLFAAIPYPYNWFVVFFNGLPLGMIWGIVFGFIEGRRTTEMLAAGMATSLIVASGAVKSVGQYLLLAGVSDFWMPFATGGLFVLPLLAAVWMLTKIPPPNDLDVANRAPRPPMTRQQRFALFREFAPGLLALIGVYMAIAAYRDFRDNFAVELWAALGEGGNPAILATAEIPIAIGCLAIVSAAMWIRDNARAFWLTHGIVFAGGAILVVSTMAMQVGLLRPGNWMMVVGFGLYLVFITYNTMLFERWIAAFRTVANVGFLVYLCDSSGYVASIGVMFYKNFGAPDLSWVQFFTRASYAVGALTILGAAFSWQYFRRRYSGSFSR